MAGKATTKNTRWFTDALMLWNQSNTRVMPWKGIHDPYRIWLSEIILQQTRVAQGLPYYERFVSTFPTVHDLASASEDEVMKLWEGLGYYSRARNLHATAQHVSQNLSGTFPDNYDDLLTLKGIGPYTAAAIASFAFAEPRAVVDGNVFRVLARFFGIDTDTQSTQGKKAFTALANELIDRKNPGFYNQATMDFGAAVCTPVTPDCAECPLMSKCEAYNNNMVDKLPVKKKTIQKRNRYFNYLQIEDGPYTYIQKRPAGDIWQGLYEFPQIESETLLSQNDIAERQEFTEWMDSVESVTPFQEVHRHILTHQRIIARFFWVRGCPKAESGFQRVRRDKIHTFAFPRVILAHLKSQTLSLSLD